MAYGEAFRDEKLIVLSVLPSSSRVDGEGIVFCQNVREHQICNTASHTVYILWTGIVYETVLQYWSSVTHIRLPYDDILKYQNM
jgi:hypothetical protein